MTNNPDAATLNDCANADIDVYLDTIWETRKDEELSRNNNRLRAFRDKAKYVSEFNQ